MKGVSSGFVLGLVLSIMTSLVLGLTVVWLNIERMELAYGLKKLQVGLDESRDLMAKLQLEKDNLVSPYDLRRKAEEYGLGPAQAGQIRRVANGGEQAKAQ